ncbi:cell division protein SepF [Staphylococcus massiliensis]|uniref:cell division protein SepF n=1 Tax=Staphylococcus massiliensis TaxID=555791 RepID=UPI001EE084B6|nr:cell division protein SepF [Staphylococcus massiliensis]MCG3401404.1 cell division protein SepF [Staphylococcus massiliensis]
MAIKDLFNGFFVMEEEDEVVEEREQRERREQQRRDEEAKNERKQKPKSNTTNQGKNHKQSSNKAHSLQSVPKKQTSRLNVSQQGTSNHQTRNVVNMNQDQYQNVQESSKMCLFEPRVFSDTQDIADELKNRRATLVNLQRIDNVSAKRIIDFLSGTVYAIGGDIQRVGQDIFLCTPDNVEVAGTITDQIESYEYDHPRN